MRYVIKRTTGAEFIGVVIEGITIEDIIQGVSSLIKSEFKLVANQDGKLIVTNGHTLVVLKLK